MNATRVRSRTTGEKALQATTSVTMASAVAVVVAGWHAARPVLERGLQEMKDYRMTIVSEAEVNRKIMLDESQRNRVVWSNMLIQYRQDIHDVQNAYIDLSSDQKQFCLMLAEKMSKNMDTMTETMYGLSIEIRKLREDGYADRFQRAGQTIRR